MGATEEHFEQIGAYEASVMKDMDAYIGLRSAIILMNKLTFQVSV